MFTPNGDGVNDVFECSLPKNGGTVRSQIVLIDGEQIWLRLRSATKPLQKLLRNGIKEQPVTKSIWQAFIFIP